MTSFAENARCSDYPMILRSLIHQIVLWILVPIIAVIAFVWVQLDDLHHRFVDFRERDIASQLGRVERELQLVQNTTEQIAKMAARDTKVVLAFNNRQADSLFRFAKNIIDSNLVDQMTFIDRQGVVLARGHDEFSFNDDMAGDKFFRIAQEGGEFSGLVDLEGGTAFIVALPIFEFGAVFRGVLIVARRIAPQFIHRIGVDLGMTITIDNRDDAKSNLARHDKGIARASKPLPFNAPANEDWILSVSKNYQSDLVILNAARKEILLFTLLATGAVLAFVYASIRYLLRPLRRLHTCLLQHQDGDVAITELNRNIITEGSPRNELGFIAHKALTTIQELERARAELQVMHHNLEQLVIARTRELSSRTEELQHEVLERKQAEARELGLKNQLQSIFDSMRCLLVGVDTAGAVTFVNAETEALCGSTLEELRGLPLNTITRLYGVSGDDILETARNNREQWQTQRFQTDLNDHRVHLDVTTYPFRVGEEVGYVIRIDDVSRQVAMEQELFRADKLQSIGILAGGIAHDFNNLLAVILGNINLVQQDRQVGGESGAYLATAAKAVHNAKKLTRELLTFAKGGKPRKKLVDLTEVVGEAVATVAKGNSCGCRLSLAAGLWPVEIDPSQIEQVIAKMMENASQAMENDADIDLVCANVSAENDPRLAQLPPGPYVCITIADSGSGMPTEILSRVFDPYFSTKGEGHGLGLAICYSIVRKHHGLIVVDSQPGQGTSFSIFLPAKPEASLPEKSAPVIKALPQSQLRVLVMDDEPMIREVVKTMLGLLGHEVILAANGEEAIACYREALACGTPPDLVLMDLVISGGMGGKDAIKELLLVDPFAKVVVCSGYSDDPILANCRQFGFVAAMAKPYTFSELQRIIAVPAE
jgi:PAS domain S-box-containing protein